MKPRTQFSIAIGLLVLTLGITWFIVAGQTQEPTQVYSATINRDCAPWDGTAFTLSFRYDPITTITISIWQSPRFAFPVTFSFHDGTMRIGTVYSVQELDPLEELSGKVTFWRVEQGNPVEGQFDFRTEAGQRLSGKFKAEWGNVVAYCG